MWKFRLNRPRVDAFEEWCATETPEGPEIKYDEFRIENLPEKSEVVGRAFSAELQAKAEPRTGINVNTYTGSQPLLDVMDVDFSKSFRPREIAPDEKGHFHQLHVDNTRELKITCGAVRKLALGRNNNITTLKNCCIGEFVIKENTLSELVLDNCWIGRIVFDGGQCVKTMVVDNGSIRSIECPPPDDNNPFTGSVTFRHVNFPTSPRRSRLLQGAQSYRSMRAHMEKLENAPAANLMRSLELATERHYDDRLFTKAVSWSYGTFADYGASPGRPLLFALVLYVFTAWLIFVFDGGDIGAIASDYFGWRAGLADVGFWGELKRSLILPLQSFVNPFGLFGVRKLVVAATGWGHVWLSVQGLITDILIAMSLFGIRRRFKLH